jgi:glycerol-3-phosphate dehydrogenase (NAD(P)+)
VISTTKGNRTASFLMMSEIVELEAPHARVAVLSTPISWEIAAGR